MNFKTSSFYQNILPNTCNFFCFIDHELYNRVITKYLPKFPYLFQFKEESITADTDRTDWNWKTRRKLIVNLYHLGSKLNAMLQFNKCFNKDTIHVNVHLQMAVSKKRVCSSVLITKSKTHFLLLITKTKAC